MVRLLLQRGADPNASSVPLPPLMLAVRSGDVDITKDLLMAGADPQVMLPQTVRISTARYNYFNCRAGGIWNALPCDEVDFSSLRRFRNSLTAKVLVRYCSLNFI